MAHNWITFLRSSFSFIFQKIQKSSRVTVFFPCKKRLKKWRKLHVLSCSEEHSYTEIRLSNGCPKSCKITPKCIENHRKMNTKKCGFRCCNGQKRTSSLHLQKYMKTRSFLYFPVLLCLHHGRKNRSKSSKIDNKMITKKATPGLAMIKIARCRTTCKIASKRVHFCRSRCCFAHAMDTKIA